MREHQQQLLAFSNNNYCLEKFITVDFIEMNPPKTLSVSCEL